MHTYLSVEKEKICFPQDKPFNNNWFYYFMLNAGNEAYFLKTSLKYCSFFTVMLSFFKKLEERNPCV